jgi:regulator of protease activity HflC (stomatin/prohibitin superfamily)
VAPDYENVVSSLEVREALGYAGELSAYQIRGEAAGQAAEERYRAEGRASALKAVIAAERDQFLAQLAAYRQAPEVYKVRTYLDALEEALRGQNLTVVPESPVNVQILDLKQRLMTDIINVTGEE